MCPGTCLSMGTNGFVRNTSRPSRWFNIDCSGPSRGSGALDSFPAAAVSACTSRCAWANNACALRLQALVRRLERLRLLLQAPLRIPLRQPFRVEPVQPPDALQDPLHPLLQIRPRAPHLHIIAAHVHPADREYELPRVLPCQPHIRRVAVAHQHGSAAAGPAARTAAPPPRHCCDGSTRRRIASCRQARPQPSAMASPRPRARIVRHPRRLVPEDAAAPGC